MRGGYHQQSPLVNQTFTEVSREKGKNVEKYFSSSGMTDEIVARSTALGAAIVVFKQTVASLTGRHTQTTPAAVSSFFEDAKWFNACVVATST